MFEPIVGFWQFYWNSGCEEYKMNTDYVTYIDVIGVGVGKACLLQVTHSTQTYTFIKNYFKNKYKNIEHWQTRMNISKHKLW